MELPRDLTSFNINKIRVYHLLVSYRDVYCAGMRAF
jgi:hypothetical protein